MATATKKKGQHGLADKKITDRALRIEIAELVETMAENKVAARDYNRAKRELGKKIEPWVATCEIDDRLEICDGEFRTIKLYQRDEFTVEAYDKKRAVDEDAGDDGDDD